MRVLWFLSVLTLLTACSKGAPPLSNPPTEGGSRSLLAAVAPARAMPLAKVSLAGGAVVAAGPDGYCLDPSTSGSAGRRGFAVIASCMILSQGKVGYDVDPVVVTVTVGPRGDADDLPTAQALADAAAAPLLGAETTAGLVLAHLGSGGDAMLQGGDRRYWRGAFLQGGRLVGLALYAPEGDAMAGARGGGLLERVRDSIRQASPKSGPSGTAAAPASAAKATSPETAPMHPHSRPSAKRVLSRLFGGKGLQ